MKFWVILFVYAVIGILAGWFLADTMLERPSRSVGDMCADEPCFAAGKSAGLSEIATWTYRQAKSIAPATIPHDSLLYYEGLLEGQRRIFKHIYEQHQKITIK